MKRQESWLEGHCVARSCRSEELCHPAAAPFLSTAQSLGLTLAPTVTCPSGTRRRMRVEAGEGGSFGPQTILALGEMAHMAMFMFENYGEKTV